MTVAPSDHPPVVDSVDEWTELIGSAFVALDIAPRTTDPLTGSVRNYDVGHLSAAEVSSTPQIVTRSSRLISQDPADLFQIGLVTHGSGHLLQDGRSCNLGVGGFAIYETARPFQWQLDGEWKLLVFTWNRTTIDLDDKESEQITARLLSGHSGISGILSRTLTEVVTLGNEIPAPTAIRFADELAAMTVTAVRQNRENTGRTDNLTQQILRYIETKSFTPNGLRPHPLQSFSLLQGTT